MRIKNDDDMTSQSDQLLLNADPHIRPLDPARDMPRVLDLIEIGFQSELDPQGWKMLAQMRHLYNQSAMVPAIIGRTSGAKGFVWVQEGQIIGNLSIRNALSRGPRGRLIGNVVVHPNYQGQGIGRALMEEAIAAAREEHAQWIGLEVRAGNAIAHHLYQQLGFKVTGCTQHLIRPGSLHWPADITHETGWRKARATDNVHWQRLTRLTYSFDQRLILEIRKEIYEVGGLERWFNLYLTRKQEKAWVHCDYTGAIDLVAHIEIERRYRFHNWEMMMHPDKGENTARELVARCLNGSRRFPAWPVIAIVPDQDRLVNALKTTGFHLHRTLQQMHLNI